MSLLSSNLRSNSSVPFLFRILDVVTISWLYYLVTFPYFNGLTERSLLILFILLSSFLFIAEPMKLYEQPKSLKFHVKTATIGWITLIVFTLVFLITSVSKFTIPLNVLFSWLLLCLVGLIGWRVAFKIIHHEFHFFRGRKLRVAVIGLTDTGVALSKEIKQHSELDQECIGFFDDRSNERIALKAEHCVQSDPIGNIQDAIDQARNGDIDSLYICLPAHADGRVKDIVHALGDTTVNMYIVPDFGLQHIMHGNIQTLGDMDIISVFEARMSLLNRFYKRVFDILFSSMVLLLISPLLICFAVLIKLSSSGPVLFRQDRYGLDGQPFKVYKFRTMRVQENDTQVVQAQKNDSRITFVGAILRKTSLDELPQFFNVLLGDMSVVGPRPHAVVHNEEYRQLVDYYMLRHKVKPGITGWAQINGWRGETDTLDKMEKRIEYDLDYIRNWSLWFDIKIIFMTLYKGFVSENAY